MATLPFKIVHASVRPARVAILVDKTDADWQHTCLRIIEIYSQLWIFQQLFIRHVFMKLQSAKFRRCFRVGGFSQELAMFVGNQ